MDPNNIGIVRFARAGVRARRRRTYTLMSAGGHATDTLRGHADIFWTARHDRAARFAFAHPARGRAPPAGPQAPRASRERPP